MSDILKLIDAYVGHCEYGVAVLNATDSGPYKTAELERNRIKTASARAAMLEELHKLTEDHEIVEWLIAHPQKATARIHGTLEFKEANFWGISAHGDSFREAMGQVMRQIK